MLGIDTGSATAVETEREEEQEEEEVSKCQRGRENGGEGGRGKVTTPPVVYNAQDGMVESRSKSSWRTTGKNDGAVVAPRRAVFS